MTIPQLIALSAILSAAGLAVLVAWRRPPTPLWPSLFFVHLAIFLWALGEATTTFVVRDPFWYRAWTVVQYAGVVLLPPTWWLFSLQFAEFHGRPPRWACAAVRHIPLMLAGALWLGLVTDPWHGSFIELRPGERSGHRMLWYVQASLGYLLLAGATSVFVRLRWDLRHAQVRSQIDTMVAACLVPLVGNILYLSAAIESRFDLTVAGFSLSGLFFSVGIYRDRLFALSSVTLQRLIQQERDGIVLLDRHGRLLFWNSVARELIGPDRGVPGDAILPALVTRISEPELFGEPAEGEGPERRLMELAQSAGGHTFAFDHPLCHWLRIEATPIVGFRGTTVGIGLRLCDVTAERQAHEVMADQAGALQAILASTDQGLLVVDSQGRMTYANQAFQELWELPDRIIESGDDAAALDFVTKQLVDPQEFLRRVRELYAEPLAESSEEILRKDGRVFERSSRPLLRDGKPAGRVWSFRDISRRLQAETERRQLEMRMQEAQKLESLGMLAGGIAHDFNNLLVGIQGNAELALEELPSNSPLRPCLRDLHDAAMRAADLTGQMLAYAGKGRFVVETIDLSALVEDTARLLDAVVSKKASLEYAFSEAALVSGDVTQLRQVVMNLITNASDALEDREGTIRISTGVVCLEDTSRPADPLARELHPGRYAFVEVGDSGCGMDEATVRRIFEPFFTTKFTGRGLGLAATLGIVRSHHGAIRVESKPGQGTIVRVLLPSIDEVRAPARPSPDDAEGVPQRGHGTVLIVDDEPSLRRTTERMLTNAGFGVLTAVDGRDGVETFEAHVQEIDVVLLDMTMPHMNGIEALQKIHAIRPDVPVILMSGYSEEETVGRLSRGERPGFLQKPYGIRELMAVLGRAFEGRDRARS